MDFFGSQEQARKKSAQLVGLFALAVLGIVAGVYGVLATGYRELLIHEMQTAYPPVRVVDPGWWFADLFVGSLLGVGVLVLLGSGFKMLSLRAGGAAIAESLGGVRIDPMTRDPGQRRLMNVVEEMAIASGVPVPDVYLMAHEHQINAFAAGFRADHAVIGVTQGTLDQLSREELQGVIAHEFSHILNGDMRLNMRLVGVLFGILLIYIIGRVVIRMAFAGGGGGRKNHPVPLMALGAVMIVLGYIGFLVGQMIKMAISRQREYLADAAAVQFTRNPEGLAGALKRIGGASMRSYIANPNAEEASHMFFSSSAKASFGSLLSTHPPLGERIRRIDPGFDGDYSRFQAPAARVAPPPVPATAKKEENKGEQWMRRAILTSVLATDRIMESVGDPAREHVAAARTMLEGLPDTIREMARDPMGARALVYAVLLDDAAEVKEVQISRLVEHADPGVVQSLRALLGTGWKPDLQLRLPMVDLCMPALRSLSDEQRGRFMGNVEVLIHADNQVDLFEFALQAVLQRGLEADGQPPVVTMVYNLKGVEQELSVVLSKLAQAGHGDEAEGKKAFGKAVDLLADADLGLSWREGSEVSMDAFREALSGLAASAMKVRKQVLAACLTCLSADGVATAKEVEIFRCVAAVIDCPVPLWMQSGEELPQLEA
ncbi:MAG TPA: M48 family metallopeptidase [Kiritimatiellia bacterium]|nr:M48 family metallopeptidase [Kiritimatiellia bacterium]